MSIIPHLCYTGMVNVLIIFGAKYLYLLVVLAYLGSYLLLKPAERKRLFFLSLLGFPVSFIIAKVLGTFIYNPRPFMIDHVQPLIAHAAGNGFPSDHTLLCMTIAAVLFPFKKKLSIVMGILAVLVGVSRVAARVHHPVDILGSIVIALFSVYVCSWILKKVLKKKHSVHPPAAA